MSMLNPTRPLVGTGLASCCTVLSIVGVIFLTVIGFAFEMNAEVLMGHTGSPHDNMAVARSCWSAAMIYAGLVAFCSCQIGLNKRYQRGAVRL